MMQPSLMSVLVFLVALLLLCHRSWAWRIISRSNNFGEVGRSSSSRIQNDNNFIIIPRRRSAPVVLRLRGGDDGDGDDDDDDKEELLYDSNTSGFGPIIRTGGFVSHIYVMSKEDNLDIDIGINKKYLLSTSTTKKCNIVCDAFEDVCRPINFDDDDDAEDYLRKGLVVARVVDRPLHIYNHSERDEYYKLIGVKEVEDDDGHCYRIYCLTVLDSFGDKEKKLLADLKELVGSDLGYVGHMLSPPPSKAEEFMANIESSHQQLNEKIGIFAGEEMSVKEWIISLRQTGGDMISKPELEKYTVFGGTDNFKETFGVDDAKEIEVTPEYLKGFFHGDIWEYPNWDFHVTKDYLFVQFGKDRGAVLQWKEPLELNPKSLTVDGINCVVNLIENDGDTFMQITSR